MDLLRHRLLRVLFGALLSFGALAGGSAGVVAAAEPRRPAPAPPVADDPPRWFKQSFLDVREDVAEAAQSGRRLMHYFYQDGCPYCTKLLRDNFGRADIEAKTRRHFDVVAINMWGDREVTDLTGTATTEKAFARALRVQFTPTLLMFDEQGQVALRLNGYIPPQRFVAALDFVAEKRERSQRFDEYVASLAGERTPRAPTPGGSAVRRELKLAERMRMSQRPLLVVFDEPQCATCDEMRRDAFVRPEVAALLRRFEVARVDARSSTAIQAPDGSITTARGWARTLRIAYAPTLVFFDATGREVFRVDGYVRPFHLASALDYVASGAYRTQPEFQRFIEARAAERREKGERVELMR